MIYGAETPLLRLNAPRALLSLKTTKPVSSLLHARKLSDRLLNLLINLALNLFGEFYLHDVHKNIFLGYFLKAPKYREYLTHI